MRDVLVGFSSSNMYPDFQPSDEQIAQIPNTTVTREQVNDEALCSVCYEDFTLGETVLQLPCKYCFHSNCVITWIRSRRKNTCPYCNSVIFAPPPWFIRLISAITRRRVDQSILVLTALGYVVLVLVPCYFSVHSQKNITQRCGC